MIQMSHSVVCLSVCLPVHELVTPIAVQKWQKRSTWPLGCRLLCGTMQPCSRWGQDLQWELAILWMGHVDAPLKYRDHVCGLDCCPCRGQDYLLSQGAAMWPIPKLLCTVLLKIPSTNIKLHCLMKYFTFFFSLTEADDNFFLPTVHMHLYRNLVQYCQTMALWHCPACRGHGDDISTNLRK